MRIACLQFAPQVGDVDNNLNRADSILSRANPKDLDLLVLPELAFSGYNFQSLQHISPFLEPTTAGITSLWARTIALKHNCVVTAGYPEKVDVSPKWPAGPEYYNSAITVNAEGETIANYRKSFLYYTDETWALEGPRGFYSGEIDGLGKVAMGICMDLNPYKFEAPWNAWEFSYHVLYRKANLVILSMAWLTREDARSYSRTPNDPDMETLAYWLARLEPIIRAELVGEVIVVLANRCGTEDEVVYAGTSAVLGIQDGEVKVYGILGRGEKELLVVDTTRTPQAKLVSEPNSAASTATASVTQSNDTEASVSTDLSSPDLEDEFLGHEEGFSPISPIDSKHTRSYFGPKPIPAGDDYPTLPLQSSATTSLPVESRTPTPTISSPSPISPIVDHPTTTKSRDESHAQNREEQELASNDLAPELCASKAPALRSPPFSASAVPSQYQSTSTSDSLGPRSRHISPRPKSSVS
ncbi:Protein N-terminal amidase [Lachnellula hyalina]|uniref:Protein N-terminal amidase n=1 Tax=Lachnellula hyalina TaxID=1316788 RepID=A0A8H8R5Y3_9HELO|nr:Protein N-terminal amidase [Lachnellula hyalina]TVY29054.1 Protein N-terminal amidase [Lachnellula hyalina]